MRPNVKQGFDHLEGRIPFKGAQCIGINFGEYDSVDPSRAKNKKSDDAHS